MRDGGPFALDMASRLLEYPNEQFFAELPAMREELYQHAREAGGNPLAGINACLDKLETMGPQKSCEYYVATFDMDPQCSLYLAWHRYGNDRGQGKAMAALNGLYRAAGFEPASGSMPDYLPLMLEFLAICEDWAAQSLLDGFGPELGKLEKRLLDAGNIYGPALSEALAQARRKWPELFAPRTKPDPTLRPMARPEPETCPLGSANQFAPLEIQPQASQCACGPFTLKQYLPPNDGE